jgi:hypothetical protein
MASQESGCLNPAIMLFDGLASAAASEPEITFSTIITFCILSELSLKGA